VRRQRFDHLIETYGFRRQREAFVLWRRRVAESVGRIRLCAVRGVQAARERLAAAAEAYGLREWPRRLEDHRAGGRERTDRMRRSLQDSLAARRLSVAACQGRLEALSPRRVLERGYCLVRRLDGTLLRTVASLAAGDPIRVEFARGDADARIEAVRTGEDHGE
jgi:exodeoxyribonuclease VII large subunit